MSKKPKLPLYSGSEDERRKAFIESLKNIRETVTALRDSGKNAEADWIIASTLHTADLRRSIADNIVRILIAGGEAATTRMKRQTMSRELWKAAIKRTGSQDRKLVDSLFPALKKG